VKTDEIRRRYLDFFVKRGHRLVAGDSLMPQDDPTLLFTGAGMNQFKEEFMGHTSDFTRATTCQKCLRTGDIENVGRTPFHFTFFEMLGNFSFGDYFKREAIGWAWEFLLEELKIDPASLHVSVYEDDQEAYDIWAREIGVAEDRIWQFGEHDNFWPADAPSKGPNGVCGPDSEIFFDHGGGCGKADCNPACDCRRFTEIWNLVFTQFERKDGGVLEPLPNKNIDTGMGLERMAAVMQGVTSAQDIDIMLPLVQAAAELTGQTYTIGQNDETAQRLKRIAEHVRCVVMAMTDGALPDRLGRGYVIRRLIRRAALDGRTFGVAEPFMYKLASRVADTMGDAYPEVRERRATNENILKGEEQRFADALSESSKGIREFEGELRKAAKGDKTLDGQQVFYFTDTHGIPVEFINEELARHGVTYDRSGFDEAREARREESRAGSNISSDTMVFKGVHLSPESLASLRGKDIASAFVGYDTLEAEATVLAMSTEKGLADSATAGDRVAVVLDATPFYAKGGGQAGDVGHLVGKDFEATVGDTFTDHEFHLQAVEITSGSLKVGDTVTARVDRAVRMDTARNHTATHLLQWALREVLGDHVRQAGSEVSAERLRFDFTHPKALTADEKRQVEQRVNEQVFADAPVAAVQTSIDAAREAGAMALFGEKYGDEVRLLSIGGAGEAFSRELCGGTHVERTSQIGLLKIVAEESVASGVRRITALTGRASAAHVVEEESLLDTAAEQVKANRGTLLKRLESLQGQVRELKRDLQKARSQASQAGTEDIFADVKDAGGVPLVAVEVPGADMSTLRRLVDVGRKQVASGVIVLGSREGGKVSLVVAVSKDLIARGLKAGSIIKEVAGIVGGGGGGRPALAQAGGKLVEKLPEAIEKAAEIVASQVG
jgi:alanyl-tRNA synthetase